MNKLIIFLTIILLLTSCSKQDFSNDNSVSINESHEVVESNGIDDDLYQNMTINNDNYEYYNELLNIKAIFNKDVYKPLSKEEIIRKYNLLSDYYDEESIKDILKRGESYYDLVLMTSYSTITLSISKPGKLTYKEILKEYPDSLLEDIAKTYEDNGNTNVSVKTDTYELPNKTIIPLISISYTDNSNNKIYQTTAFNINDEYLGIFNIISINKDAFIEIINLFE